MNDRTPITLIQDAAGQIIALRIGGVELPVLHAGPVVGPGQMNLVTTITNVDLSYELREPASN